MTEQKKKKRKEEMLFRNSKTLAWKTSSTLSRSISNSLKAQSTHFVYSHQKHVLDEANQDKRDEMHKRRPGDYLLFQPVYTDEQLHTISITHVEPPKFSDRLAYWAVSAMRGTFDLVTGYGRKKFDETKWLQRVIFLETVAGVPGMVGAMHRHMRSLRNMKRDKGWVHTLLEEAENERMHLLTFLQLRKPSLPFRFMVLVGQGVFFNLYFGFYMVSPKYCHRFVGYLEEEAVKTYTHLYEEIEKGNLKEWATLKAPEIAMNYWKLPTNSTIKDLILAVRADEANHRDVNHVLSEIQQDDPNPFSPPIDSWTQHNIDRKPSSQ